MIGVNPVPGMVMQKARVERSRPRDHLSHALPTPCLAFLPDDALPARMPSRGMVAGPRPLQVCRPATRSAVCTNGVLDGFFMAATVGFRNHPPR